VSLLTALLVASLVAAPPALAQPSGSAFIYWANLSPNTIGRGTIDGNPTTSTSASSLSALPIRAATP
jgi:hypothetical protein